jgi:hypothetical protein
VHSTWLQTVKFIVKKLKCASLAHGIAFFVPNSCNLRCLVKAQHSCAPRKKSVINWSWLRLSIPSDILSTGGVLLWQFQVLEMPNHSYCILLPFALITSNLDFIMISSYPWSNRSPLFWRLVSKCNNFFKMCRSWFNVCDVLKWERGLVMLTWIFFLKYTKMC